MSKTILRPVSPDTVPAKGVRVCADALVLTRDGKILLQQRDHKGRHPGCLVAFGGGLDPVETVMEGLVREMREELGAVIDPADLIFLCTLEETIEGETQLLHSYFWHDARGTVTGCYEGHAAYYDRVAGALAHPGIMDYLKWALRECQKRGLLPADEE